MVGVDYNDTGVFGTTITGSGFSAECALGTILAIDKDGSYVPAKAEWSPEPGRNGCNVPALSSYVVGVLVSEPTGGSGTILCDGIITNPDIISAMIPETEADDTAAYYLSMTTAGTAVKGPDSVSGLVTFCFTHRRISGSPINTDQTSGNLTRAIIFKPAAPEYAGHSHHYVEFPDVTWSYQDTDSVATIPANTEAADLLTASGSSLALLRNGTQMPRECWGFEPLDDGSHRLTLFGAMAIREDHFTLCGTTPFTAREPVVRGLKYGRTGDGLFKFSGMFGQLEMSFNEANYTDNEYTGTAVVGLDDTGAKRGPVVQELISGPGVSITEESIPGVYKINSNAVTNSYIDMQVCNLDGVVFGSDDIATSFVFPSGVSSSLTGVIRAPHYSGNIMRGEIRIVVRGGVSAGKLTAYCKILTPPDEENNGAIPTTATQLMLNATAVGSSDNSAYLITSDKFEVAADSLVYCRVTADNPSTKIEVFSVSLVLAVAD